MIPDHHVEWVQLRRTLQQRLGFFRLIHSNQRLRQAKIGVSIVRL
jgi:hypothetical protein